MSELLPHSDYGVPVSEKRRTALFSTPTDRLHGTRTGYLYGCRCDTCRFASREYSRVLAAKRKAGWRA